MKLSSILGKNGNDKINKRRFKRKMNIRYVQIAGNCTNTLDETEVGIESVHLHFISFSLVDVEN